MRNSIIKALTVLLMLIITVIGNAANRYWVNGGGMWNDPNHWSETSGGKPGTTLPTQFDNVIFNNNSFTQNGQQVIIKSSVACNDFTWEVDNYKAELKSKSFLFKEATKADIKIYGSVTINENIDNQFFGDIYLRAEKESFLIIKSQLNSNLYFDSEKGSWVVESDLSTTKNIQLIAGDLNLNNKDVDCDVFTGNGDSFRALNMTNSNVTVNRWDFQNTSNLEYVGESYLVYVKSENVKRNVLVNNIEVKATKAGSKADYVVYPFVITSATCHDRADGTFTMSVSGGVTPYTYTLKNNRTLVTQTYVGNDVVKTFTGLTADSYYARVEDAIGSVFGSTYTLGAPPEFIAESIGVNVGLSCSDASDAELEAYATGGTAPYTYQWQKYNFGSLTWEDLVGETNKVLTGVSQGWYQVIIRDVNGCGAGGFVSTNLIFIRGYDSDEYIPEELSFTSITSKNTCVGTDNGTITMVASGGTGDIDYYLIRQSDLAVIPTGPPYDEDGVFTGLQDDTYETYAIDENGCTIKGTDVTITEVTNPTASITPDPASTCPSVGLTLNGNPAGGSGTYVTHAWTGAGSSSLSPTNTQSTTFTNATSGSYALTYTVTDDIGCTGSDNINVTVKVASVAPTSASVDHNNFCPGAFANITLSYVGGTLGTGATARWYTDAGFTVLAGTGQNLVIASPAVTTTYYVRFEGDCNNTTAASITVTILSSSTAPTSINSTLNNICPGQSTTLTVQGGSLGGGATWQWYTGSCGGTAAGTGASINVTPAVTTTYYVRAEGDCNTTTCASITITVKTQSTIPTGISTDNNNFCPGQTANLTVTGGSLGTGASWRWYTGSCGGTSAGSGASISVSPIVTTTYYVRAEGDCNTTLCVSTTITVKVASIAPTTASVNNNNFCPGAFPTITLSYVGGTLGTGATAEWYTDGTYTTNIGSGQNLIIAAPAVTTTYYVRFEGDCNNTTGPSVTVTVKTQSTAPTGITNDNTNFCPGGTANLTVTGGSLGTNATWRWYTGSCGGTSVGSGTTISVSPAVTTTYYVRAEGDCNNTTCANLTVTVKVASVAPTSATVNNNNFCPGAFPTITLSYVGGTLGTGAVARWYSDAGFTNLVGTGQNLVIAAPAVTTTYYVRFEGDCNSTTPASVTVTIKTQSVAPTSAAVNNNNFCAGIFTNIILSYSGGTIGTGATAEWYSDAALTISVGSGQNLSIPAPAVTTTYYVRFEGDCNNTSAVSITVTVFANPTASITPDPAITCTSVDLNLNGNPLGGTPAYTHAWTGTNLTLLSNPTIQNPIFNSGLSGTYNYTYTVTDINGCKGTDNISVLVHKSATADAGVDTLLCYGTPYYIQDADSSDTPSITWSSVGGDGTFDDANIIDPTYTPGANDLINGFVDLVLTAQGTAPCSNVTDTMRITYLPQLLAAIGKPTPFYIDSTSTHIEVYIKIASHRYNADLGLYLVSPVDSVVELKPYCTGFPSANQNITLNFYNDPLDTASLSTISTCSPTSGRYAFSGDWKKQLHGQDPSNGAWSIRIVDALNISGPDGFLEEATLKFSDFNQDAIFESVLYEDSLIHKPIKEYSGSGPYARTSHVLSLTGLTTSCFGLCDATAVATGSGGQPPYASYKWSTSLDFSSPIATGDTVDLCVGTYYVEITDSHGCIAIDSIVVNEPPEIKITNDSIENITCHGDSTGVIMLEFNGGTGTLEYTLDSIDWFASGHVFEDLGAGTYDVIIRDLSGCFKDTTIILIQPDSIQITVTHTDVTCWGDDDGTIQITALGGQGPLEYSIDSGATYFDNGGLFIDLPGDTFYIAVMDSVGCERIWGPEIIFEPDSVSIDSVKVNLLSCVGGGTDGQIIVYGSGGVGELYYSIDGGAFTTDSAFNSLTEGFYQMAVRDDNGCTKLLDSLIHITYAAPIIVDSLFITDVSGCYGDSTGQIRVYASGGSGTLSYKFRGVTQTSNLFIDVWAGTDTIFISDEAGCQIDTVITIGQPDELIITSLDIINVRNCVNISDLGEIVIHAIGGTGVGTFIYSVDEGANTFADSTFINLPEGTYYIYVEDVNGCIALDTADIITPEEFLVSSEVQNIYCLTSTPKDPALSNGRIIPTVTGGDPDFVYLWSGPAGYTSTEDTIRNLSVVGEYTLIVTDERGCEQYDTLAIIEDPAFDISISYVLDTNNICSYTTGINFEFTLSAVDTIIWQIRDVDASMVYMDTSIVTSNPFIAHFDPLVTSGYLYTALNEFCQTTSFEEIVNIKQGVGLSILDDDEPENDTIDVKITESRYTLVGMVQNITVSATFTWTPITGIQNVNSLVTDLIPDVARWYYLSALTADDCAELDSIYINFIPNVFASGGFSPNGDGINDYWNIEGIDDFPNNVVQVFTRWGIKVFIQAGYSNLDTNKQWDGKAGNGNDLPTGTYYYIIHTNEKGYKPITGPVTIVR